MTNQAESLDRRGMTLLSSGHACADMCQGAVPALLPFLVIERGYSLGAAAALVLAVTVSSSIVQPIFGHLSDRRSLPWLMPAGLALAGLGLGLAGLATTHALTFSAITLSGLGIAAFHPEGSRYANYVSGARRATGMSLFSVGGNAGFALGPALVTPAVLATGLHGTLIVGLIPIALAGVLAVSLGYLRAFRPNSRAHPVRGEAAIDQWRPFARLSGVVAARSVLYFGLMTFVPIYFIRDLGRSKAEGNTALTIMLAAGAIGTLVGGRLADRFGRRIVLLAAMVVLTPLLACFLAADAGVATGLLVLIGMATIATFSVTVVMGQEYLPNRIGIASGVTLGLAIGIGGVAAALLGLLADATSITTVLWLLTGLPLVGTVLTLTLPSARAERARAAARVEAGTPLTAIPAVDEPAVIAPAIRRALRATR